MHRYRLYCVFSQICSHVYRL